MKIALVHDYLYEFGGAERVLLTLSEMYPKAPIYTIFYKKNSQCGKYFSDKKIVTTWLNYVPYSHRLISPFRFLVPLLWRQFDFSKYDLVLTSSSWAVTKGMRNAKREICYLHTPPRYLYGYDTSRKWKGKWYAKFIDIYALIVNHFMRMYDFNQAQKVTFFIANSINTGKRIEKFYRRNDYRVVYPPVRGTSAASRSFLNASNRYYLTGGRMVASKNFDLIIKAAIDANVNLKVFGAGIDQERLRSLVMREDLDRVRFLGIVTEEELISLYQNAKAFIVAQKDEDFGITSIEAAGAGCPTIAYRGGGYLESVIENKTGIFFDELTSNSIVKAIKKIEKLKFKKEDLLSQAKKFSKERFIKEIKEVVNKYSRV